MEGKIPGWYKVRAKSILLRSNSSEILSLKYSPAPVYCSSFILKWLGYQMRSGGSMSSKKVVIVGAGCAGLSAAYTLKKLGVEVQVFEAGSMAGGRCRTIVEDGYEFIAGAGSTEPQWATTFQYLDELGLKDRVYSIQKQRFGMYPQWESPHRILRRLQMGYAENASGEPRFFSSPPCPGKPLLRLRR